MTYTRNVKDDQAATYDCGLCGHFAVDVDGARAHHAVHVAGPDLLAAIKIAQEQHPDDDGIYTTPEIEAAVSKAEPKGA